MKNKNRTVSIQFWVSPQEEAKIAANVRRNGMDNLSQYLRILALSDVQISFSVHSPNIMRASDAQFKTPEMDERTERRVVG